MSLMSTSTPAMNTAKVDYDRLAAAEALLVLKSGGGLASHEYGSHATSPLVIKKDGLSPNDQSQNVTNTDAYVDAHAAAPVQPPPANAKNPKMVRFGKKLPAAKYVEMKRGIYTILLGARDVKGMGGTTVSEELRRGLDASVLEYYETAAEGSKGSRSLRGYVDDILSGMRTKGYLSNQGQLTDIGLAEALLVLGLDDGAM